MVLSSTLVALLFGTFVGSIVQWVALALERNDDWVLLSKRKKFALVATGSIASFVAGSWILSANEVFSEQMMYRMWFWQMLAAWMGAFFLDKVSRYHLQWAMRDPAKREEAPKQ